jgi:Na+/pantothenate symporter
MQTEVLLPLIAYLLVVFGLSVFAYTRRQQGSFLTEYFLGNRSMGGFVLAMTLTATTSAPARLSAGRVQPINTGWAGCCWR